MEGLHWPLESIAGVGWGSVKHIVNGIPTDSDCYINFIDQKYYGSVYTKRGSVYTAFVDRLRMAVGGRIIVGMLKALARGEKLTFADAVIADEGIKVTCHRLLGKNEPVYSTWDQVAWGSADGSFMIARKEDHRAHVTLPYIKFYNVNLLEIVLGRFRPIPGARLSSLLRNLESSLGCGVG